MQENSVEEARQRGEGSLNTYEVSLETQRLRKSQPGSPIFSHNSLGACKAEGCPADPEEGKSGLTLQEKKDVGRAGKASRAVRAFGVVGERFGLG